MRLCLGSQYGLGGLESEVSVSLRGGCGSVSEVSASEVGVSMSPLEVATNISQVCITVAC